MNIDYLLQAHGFGGRVSKDKVPPPKVIGFTVTKDGENAKMTWTNPIDTDFVGVVIVKKLKSYPTSAADGEVIYKGDGTSYTDTNVKKAEYVYYRAFSYDFDNNYNTKDGQTGSILVKGTLSAPNAPTLKSVTYDTVELNTSSGLEYSKDGSSWQTSGVFSGLRDGTTYTFYARRVGNSFYYTSPKSSGLSVTTKVKLDDKIGAPGNRKLLKGTMQQGWFGEVPSSSFITGDELARMVGISAGNSQYSDTAWLKFAYMGNVELVPKKAIRNSISWDNINAAGCVFGKEITIKGKKYKVRLIKGKTEGKQNDSSNYQNAIHHGSEWNLLMLPIHKNAPSSWAQPNSVKSPTENWNVGYTDQDLLTHTSFGNGSYSWCQEYGESTNYRLLRGREAVSFAGSYSPSSLYAVLGWRPCLELIG